MSKPYLFILTIVTAATLSCGSLFAGGEPLPDTSKEPAPMVEARPECDTRWYVSVGSGHEIDLGSDFSSGFEESFDGAFIDIHSRDYDDVFDNWYNVIGEVGYAFTDHFEVFANFKYTHARSRLVSGSEIDFGFFDLEFLSKYGDYNSWGGELGARYYFFRKGAPVRPYIQAAGGVQFVDDIDLHVTSEFFGDNVVVYDGGFYDSSTTWTASGAIGLEFNVTCNLAITLDAGVRWQSELDGGVDGSSESESMVFGTNGQGNGFDEGFISSIVSELNDDGGSRFYAPVNVAVKFKF